MKILRFRHTLLYYDSIQLFEALDAIGGHYLCLLTELGESFDRYLVVGVSPERIQEFRLGTVDLLELIVNRELSEWFYADTDRKSTRLNSSHIPLSRMPSSA